MNTNEQHLLSAESEIVRAHSLKLSAVRLDNRELKTLPNCFELLTDVEMVHLDNNELQTLPESFTRLKKLEHASLNNNKLNVLPESFGNLRSLTMLYLNVNCLSSLPDSLASCQNLVWLNLSDNLFKNIPPCLAELNRLRVLSIQNNQLRTFTDDQLPPRQTLEVLELDGNHLIDLPRSLWRRSDTLSTVTITGQKHENGDQWRIPLVVLNQSVDELFSWLKNNDPESNASACAQCGHVPASLKCSYCKAVFYCSKETNCQSLHWRSTHRIQCSKKYKKQ